MPLLEHPKEQTRSTPDQINYERQLKIVFIWVSFRVILMEIKKQGWWVVWILSWQIPLLSLLSTEWNRFMIVGTWTEIVLMANMNFFEIKIVWLFLKSGNKYTKSKVLNILLLLLNSQCILDGVLAFRNKKKSLLALKCLHATSLYYLREVFKTQINIIHYKVNKKKIIYIKIN